MSLNGILYALERNNVCHKTDYRMSLNGVLYALERNTVCHKTDHCMPE